MFNFIKKSFLNVMTSKLQIKIANVRLSKDSKLKCSICNKYFDFYIHDCKKTIGMYYGCIDCDNYCDKCLKKEIKENESKQS